jgi:hypothetical protein
MLWAIMRRPAFSGELGISRFAAETCGSACEDYRSPSSQGHNPTCRLAPDEKSGEAANTEELLEQRGFDLQELLLGIIADVEDDEIRWRKARA